jgi:hypothetical protein
LCGLCGCSYRREQRRKEDVSKYVEYSLI